MQNLVQRGKVITLTSPYSVTSGNGVLVGSIFGVATTDVANGVKGEFQLTGVFTLPKTSALAIAVGDLIYWDDTAKVVNKTNTNKLIGVAVSVAANPSASVDVRLNGAFIS